MKFECSAKKLLAALRRVMPAVITGSAAQLRPITACALVSAAEGVVKLGATDMNTWITAEVEATYGSPGTIAIPADNLGAVLAELGNDNITLTRSADGATLTGPAGRFQFPTKNPDEFPAPPEHEPNAVWFDLAAESLRTLIRRTTFACDRIDSSKRFLLTGAVLERQADSAVMVATDTKRVALASVAVAGSSGEDTPPNEWPPIIPAKVFAAVDRAIEDGEVIRVRVQRSWVQFEAPRWSLVSAIVEGRFPPYRKLFCEEPSVRMKVNSAEFMSSIRRAAVMTDSESSRIDIEFAFESATLSARGAKTGASSIEHPLPDYDGPATAIAFDPAYAIDWFKAVGADQTVSIEIADPKKPITFRANDDAHYLLMPLTS